MDRISRSAVAALIGALLWLGWHIEQAQTGIRAPWTAMTLTASALAFVASGFLGRGWRPVVAAGLAGAGAVLVLFIAGGQDVNTTGSCDPGCVTPGPALLVAAGIAAVLACAGIALRRAAALAHRRDSEA